MTNEEKAGKWLRYGGTQRVIDPCISLRLVTAYGAAEMTNYLPATEEEIHTAIEASRAEPSHHITEACPCGKYAAWKRGSGR